MNVYLFFHIFLQKNVNLAISRSTVWRLAIKSKDKKLWLTKKWIAISEGFWNCERFFCFFFREGNIGYMIASEAAYNIYRNCLKFIVPGLIYSIAFVPVIIKELYGINHGEIGNLYWKTAYDIWYACCGVFVALLNLVFYGLGSSNFRRELKNLWYQLAYEVRIRRRGDLNTSSAWINTTAQLETLRSSDNDFRHDTYFDSDVTRMELNHWSHWVQNVVQLLSSITSGNSSERIETMSNQ